MSKLEIQAKFTIVKDGEKVFGPGPYKLLENVERLGSLSKACQELNMSYSKGWRVLNQIEKLLGYKLTDSQAGGSEGGGSSLTKEGKNLLKAYESYKIEAEEEAKNLFEKYFKEI